MTQVVLWRSEADNQGRRHVEGFAARGHTGYARAGSDIVCSAVSALTQGTLLGILQVAEARALHGSDEKAGELYCLLDPGTSKAAREKAWILLDTLALALKEIERQYPRYLRVEERDWNESVYASWRQEKG
ncbi:MAG: ribosomal-processing cysteine protease Prp [Limnochordales bacterium]|nr:ribosomal-processing cysteine protease Prp [Limnochordales bacterium]